MYISEYRAIAYIAIPHRTVAICFCVWSKYKLRFIVNIEKNNTHFYQIFDIPVKAKGPHLIHGAKWHQM